ncbi:hypothetical protein LguiB_033822 [Lonicera macranthoides]
MVKKIWYLQQQTLVVLTKNPNSIPITHLSKIHKPYLALNPQSLVRLLSYQTKSKLGLNNNTRIKCSLDYKNKNNGYYEYEQKLAPQYPKPLNIQWKKELCNSGQLIGNIGTPVQIKHLNSDKVITCEEILKVQPRRIVE